MDKRVKKYLYLHEMKRFIRIALQNELSVSFIALLIFFLLFFTSCASDEALYKKAVSQQAPVVKSASIDSTLAQKRVETRKPSSAADYVIGPEDLLEIDTFQVQELKSLVRVSAKGFIKLPLVDKVQAAGLTVSELESLIAQRLTKYLQEPVVSVFVKEYRSQQISVLGSVRDPRVYYVSGQKYLLDMISLAGGLTPEAGTVCVIRKAARTDSNNNDYSEKILVDLRELIVNGRDDLNFPVSSWDIIHVPKSGIFFVDGAVRTPGEFPLKDATTFTEAISMAKGLGYEAKHSDIKIYRDSGKAEREVIEVDYDAILAGNTKDIPIQDRDIIIVSTSTLKFLVKGLSAAISFGAVRVGKGW